MSSLLIGEGSSHINIHVYSIYRWRMMAKWGYIEGESYNGHIALIKQWPPGGLIPPPTLKIPSSSPHKTKRSERERTNNHNDAMVSDCQSCCSTADGVVVSVTPLPVCSLEYKPGGGVISS